MLSAREIKTCMRASLGAEVNRGIMHLTRQRPAIRGRQAGRVLFCMRSLSYGIFYLYRRYAAPLMGGAASYAYQSSYIPCFIDKHYPLHFMLHFRNIAWSQD